MLSKTFVFIVCAFAIVHMGNSLVCNLCIGSLDSDCANNITRSMATQTCSAPRPHPHYRKKPKTSVEQATNFDGTLPNDVDEEGPTPNIDLHCVYLTLKGDRFSSDIVERECVYTYSNIDFCDFMRKRRRNIDACSTCDSNQCN